MNSDDLRALYAHPAGPVNPGLCPTPEQLHAAALGRGHEAERLATMDHIAGCSACRPEFELMRAVAVAEREDAGARFRRTVLTGLAAAVVLAFGAPLIWRAGQPEPLRGGSDVLRLIAPGERWTDAAPPQFVWSSVGEGTVYLFELVDSSGRARFSATTRDTLTTLPDSVRLAPGAEHRWWVRGRRTDGQEVVSALRRVRVSAP